MEVDPGYRAASQLKRYSIGACGAWRQCAEHAIDSLMDRTYQAGRNEVRSGPPPLRRTCPASNQEPFEAFPIAPGAYLGALPLKNQ
jgi:hypothetical protein